MTRTDTTNETTPACAARGTIARMGRALALVSAVALFTLALGGCASKAAATWP